MAASVVQRTVYVGRFIHCKSLDELETLSLVAVDEFGKIVAVDGQVEKNAISSTVDRLGWEIKTTFVHKAADRQFYFPGFIGDSLQCFGIHITCLTLFRYSHPCVSVSQCGYIWQIYSSRLVEHLHFPT